MIQHPFKLKTLWYSRQQKRNARFATLQDIIQEQVCYRIQTLPPSSRTHAWMDMLLNLAQFKPSRRLSLSWLSETRLHRDRKNKLSDFSLLGSLPSLTCWGNEGLSLKACKRSLHDCLTYKGNRDKHKTHIRGGNENTSYSMFGRQLKFEAYKCVRQRNLHNPGDQLNNIDFLQLRTKWVIWANFYFYILNDKRR